MSSAETFLEVQNLKTHFPVEKGFLFKRRLGEVKAVDGVSFSLRQGEILGLVGESGCGKSTLGRTILPIGPAHRGRGHPGRPIIDSIARGPRCAKRVPPFKWCSRTLTPP